MKIVKVFVASSSELKQERMELVDLFQDMNDEYREQGIKWKPVLWEYMDSSMRSKRKEDEYLEQLRGCEVCIVLFWRTIGEYTMEELDVANTEMLLGRRPRKIHIFFKELEDGASVEAVDLIKHCYEMYPDVSYKTFNDVLSLRNLVKHWIVN